MLRIIFCLLVSIFNIQYAKGQNVAINNDGSFAHASSILEIKSTSKGMLIPRMTQLQRDLISSPATGLLIYQTDNTTGFYFFNGSIWTSIVGSSAPAWSLTGNSGTNQVTDFIGTSDASPLRFRVNNIWAGELHPANGNSFFGKEAGFSVTSGYDNSSFGANALFSNTTGYQNTALGKSALYSNTTGFENTAVGKEALYTNATGYLNTAIGWQALYSNTAYNNTAMGASALKSNITGINNCAIGYNALYSNSAGVNNTATGAFALSSNTLGDHNTAIGLGALQFNVTGTHNTAIGSGSLLNNLGHYNTGIGYTTLASNTTGQNNTATGYAALSDNTTGDNNTAIGSQTMTNTTGGSNTAVGKSALETNTTGSYNTAIGELAQTSTTTGFENVAVGAWALRYNTTGYQNVAIGSDVLLNNVSGTGNIAIGKSAGTTGSFNNTVSIGNNGALNTWHNQILIGNYSTGWNGGNVVWSTYSDARIKKNIREDVRGLDFISRLRPITYYRDIDLQTQITGNQPTEEFPHKYDIEQIKFSGFLAQEVEQAAVESGYNFSGITKPRNEHELYTLSYESFVVPLVKGMQEQQAIIQNQEARIHQLESEMASIKILLQTSIKN